MWRKAASARLWNKVPIATVNSPATLETIEAY